MFQTGGLRFFGTESLTLIDVTDHVNNTLSLQKINWKFNLAFRGNANRGTRRSVNGVAYLEAGKSLSFEKGRLTIERGAVGSFVNWTFAPTILIGDDVITVFNETLRVAPIEFFDDLDEVFYRIVDDSTLDVTITNLV